jgi:hypothetical protein
MQLLKISSVMARLSGRSGDVFGRMRFIEGLVVGTGPAHRGVMREALTVMYPGWGAGAMKTTCGVRFRS